MACATYRVVWHVFVASVLTLGLGCSSQPGETLHPVSGRITLDGQPLPRGSVSLRPDVTASTLHQPTGMVEPPGEYVVYTNGRAGAPPGRYRVVVFATDAAAGSDGSARPGLPKSLVPICYNQPERSPLQLEVVAKPTANGYDLELNSNEK